MVKSGSDAQTMRAARVAKAGAALEMVDLPMPQPGRDQVRLKVQACGVCHSDFLIKEGLSAIRLLIH
jgi:D-arabinose 1-dehydrogenase-like Zn-dependent alcohol dehydrogenase